MASELGLSQSLISQAEAGSPLGRDAALAVVDRWPESMVRLGLTAEDLLRGSRERGAA